MSGEKGGRASVIVIYKQSSAEVWSPTIKHRETPSSCEPASVLQRGSCWIDIKFLFIRGIFRQPTGPLRPKT